MRCLCLAEKLKQNFNIVFIAKKYSGNLGQKIRKKGFSLYFIGNEEYKWKNDLKETIKVIKKIDKKIEWLIVDNYDIDKKWELGIKEYCNKIAVIDDLANREHYADLLIDSGYSAKRKQYKLLTNSHCKILCGTKYAILRKEFYEERRKRPYEAKNNNLLNIFFGGFDRKQFTFKLAKLVAENFKEIKIMIIVSLNYEKTNALRKLKEKYTDRIEIFRNPKNLAELYGKCDFACGSPGISTWERACLGLPSFYFATADSQVPILKKLENSGFCEYGGKFRDIKEGEVISQLKLFLRDKKKLSNMRDKSLKSVDGLGVNRIIKHFA